MKVAVIGSVNYDIITTPGHEKKKSLGGVLYNVIVLSSLLGENSEVYLITAIGRKHCRKVFQLFESSKTVDLGGVKINPKGTNENYLIYASEQERMERLIVRTGPFNYNDIYSYLHSDLILFNFITGSEIQLSLLKKIRSNSDSIIYVDVHSKVLGMKEDGTRYPFGWPDWDEWFKHIDIVQMNLDECRLLLKENVESAHDLQSAAKRIAEAGPSQVLITLGEDGAFVYWQNGEGRWKLIPASTHRVLDTTGCGDCFTAGYIWGLFKYKDLIKATCIANVVAGENCGTIGLIGELDVNRIEGKALRLYPHLFHR